ALNDILHTMIRKNKTILLITHDVEFAAVSSDNMAMMFDGRLVAYESTEAFLNNNYFYQI
ncbi:MAG TPA: cobalt ABC transporter ATP-binding protein, partial [Lachnospiraceae bacterium]|nr:cobalt ABC transporter ATP-binding protein [Lachnospiraceae bacterium]